MINLTEVWNVNKAHPDFEVWEASVCGYRTLRTRRVFRQGESLGPFDARQVSGEPGRLSVQVGAHQHILLNPAYLEFLNHSCNPNVFFDFASGQVRALRNIRGGDELTYFYPSTEWELSSPFTCHCGEPGCLGIIRGAARVDPEVLVTYTLAEHIRDMVIRSEKAA